MHKIAAIAAMTIRTVMRSRVFAAAAFFLIIVMAGLPFIIEGDGTLESRASIFIDYACGLLMFILSLAATWCGAGAISLEISGGQMQSLVSKPLRSAQIWTGKLLGLMTINLLLLVLGGGLICAMLHWTLRPAGINIARQYDARREIMTVYRTIPPLSYNRSAGGGKTSSPQGGVAAAIGPGQSFRWRFNPARHATDRQFALLKFRFIPSPFSHQSPVTGVWRVFNEKGGVILNKSVTSSPNMACYLTVPKPDTAGFLELEYLNLQTNPPVTVFFPSENELSLLIPESTFTANLLRGLIMGFARLAFFASLGMLAGTLFTFPVAVFTSMGLMAIAFSGGFMHQLAERGLLTNAAQEQAAPAAILLNEMVRASFHFLAAVLPPLDRFDPLAFLADKLFIPWNLAGQSLAVLCGLYPLILILIGAGCLSRREAGLLSQ